MSIASLFKPVDSSKTRLPRTDVLERVAKYADGKSVVSNYFDISTEELINMLRKDLVPASEIEYVSDIVRTRLSGETTAAPKKSVGETIKNTAKDFTVSDPTKDFITLEDIIGTSSTPKDPTGVGINTDQKVGDDLQKRFNQEPKGGFFSGEPNPTDPYVRPSAAEPSSKQDYIPFYRPGGARPEGEASGFPVAIAPGGARPEGKTSGLPAVSQSEIDAYKSKILREKFDRETLGTGGFFANDPPAFVAGADPTRTTNVPVLEDFQRGTGSDGDFGSGFSRSKVVRPDADRVARGLDSLQSLKDSRTASIMAENLGGSDAIKVDQVKSANKPGEDTAATSEIASMLKDPRNLENTGLIDTLKRYLGPTPVQQAVSQMQQELTDAEKAERKAQPTQRLRPPVSSTIEPPVKRGTSITEFLYGSGEAQLMEEEATALAAAEAADQGTTDRMHAREAGISALPSDVGAATDKSGGIVPRGVDPTGIGRDSTPTPAFIAGTDPTRTTTQPSATPTAAPVIPDKPTKDEKNDIKKAANEVAKNPSVGGIQSLFEQAGFSDALLQLGLGMMASKNPDFLGSLGESGQAAVALMAKQREEAKKAKLEADKLDLEKQRNAIYGRSVDNAATTDKRPAIVQTSEAYSTAIKTAQEQAKNNVFDTTEQFMAREYAYNKIVPAAQEAAQKAAIAWDKIYEGLSPSKKKEYDEKTPKDVYVNKAYQDSLQQNPTLYKLLNIGVPTEENKVKKFDVATGTLIN